jgi:GTP-binding protein
VRLDDAEFVVADIPGLIEGASAGRGLGHQFLRHVERARALCVLLDLAPVDGLSPEEQERVLVHELGAYRPDLLDRPRLVVGTKADVAQDHADWHGRRISAVTGAGLADLTGALAQLVAEARDAEPEPEGFLIHRPTPEGVTVERIADGEFRVRGRAAERAVALSDLTNRDALAYADARLKRLGVDRALARAGASPGDVVWVGEFSFEYDAD